jgi:hypothetical protein
MMMMNSESTQIVMVVVIGFLFLPPAPSSFEKLNHDQNAKPESWFVSVRTLWGSRNPEKEPSVSVLS